MADTSEKWASGVQGIFKLHMAVVQAMPSGTRVISANPWGVSAWTKTAKVSVILSDGTPKKYFLKCATGREARPLTEGEYHSATAIHSVVPGFVPKPCGWGRYWDGESLVYFFLGDFYDMEIQKVPDPESVATIDGELVPEPELFAAKVAELHTKGNLLRWEASWAKCFTNQLQDVIKYDNETNGIWPELDAACEQVINAVIPRLLGVLQSDGRSIEPVLIHGDLWEQNVGIDKETGQTIVFDPGCTYAHNEMDFGTWRCSWARQFRVPIYMELYQQHIKPSDPQNEWDDRNRLYSLHPYLNDSAGHPGSTSRSIAYNDMLYLCDKYAPLEILGRYNPEHDVSITGVFIQHETYILSKLNQNIESFQCLLKWLCSELNSNWMFTYYASYRLNST